MSSCAVQLELEDVRKIRRDGKGQDREILRGVSWSVNRSEFSAIIGPSGGGKSTLVRLVNRLEDPTSGRILLSGQDVMEIEPLALRRRVALVTQKPFMFPGTVQANLELVSRFRDESPSTEQAEHITRVLEWCHIGARLRTEDARSLSLGEQQRVSLARALLGKPELLLLDEPTSALDRPTATSLADTLAEIGRSGGPTLLMVTHDLPLAEQVVDRLAYLEEGRILEEGPAGTLLTAPGTEALKKFLALPSRNRGGGPQ